MLRMAFRLAAFSCLAASFLLAREYGPAVGSKMPDFELRDQDGQAHNLQSLLGPKGGLILFFRSADW